MSLSVRVLLPVLLPLLGAASLAAPVTDQTHGLTVTPPAGWQKTTYPGTALVFVAPKAIQGFNPNVNIIVQTLPKGITQAQYHQLSTGQIPKVITDGKVVSGRAVKLGGQPANELVYTGRQGQAQLYFNATYAVRGGKAYIVTFTTVKGQEAALKPSVDAFIKSFRFTR